MLGLFVKDHFSACKTAKMSQPQKKQFQFKYMFPLLYAPILPLIRISLRKRPVLRDRMFGLGVLTAFLHGGYILLFDLDMTGGERKLVRD